MICDQKNKEGQRKKGQVYRSVDGCLGGQEARRVSERARSVMGDEDADTARWNDGKEVKAWISDVLVHRERLDCNFSNEVDRCCVLYVSEHVRVITVVTIVSAKNTCMRT